MKMFKRIGIGAGSAASSPEEGAAHWRARLESATCTQDERAAFAVWCAASPANKAAVEALDTLLGRMSAHCDAPGIRQLRATALAGSQSRIEYRWAAAAAVVLIIGVAMFLPGLKAGLNAPTGNQPQLALVQPTPTPPGLFETAVGERSTVALSDGSTVTLNTSTRLAVEFSASTRLVRLMTGQAIFDVAANPSRPFVVEAGGRRITALGTSFDVRLESGMVRVSLLEGRVVVVDFRERAADGAPHPRRLSAGEQLIAPDDAEAVVRPVDVGAVTSWREGWLVFEDEKLADAVREINRYSHTQIVIVDQELAELELSAVFRTGQTDSVIAALLDFFPVQARRVDDTRIELASRK